MTAQELIKKVNEAQQKALSNPCKRIKVIAGYYYWFDGTDLYALNDWVSGSGQTYWQKEKLVPWGDGTYIPSLVDNEYTSLKQAIYG